MPLAIPAAVTSNSLEGSTSNLLFISVSPEPDATSAVDLAPDYLVVEIEVG